MNEIPQVAYIAICELLKILEGLIISIKALDKQVTAQVAAYKQAQLLMSAPGVGPLTSLWFIAEIGNPERFRYSKRVGAYVGITPRQYSSGEMHKQGRISKCGPKELRTLLTEAGIVILTRTNSWSKLKAWGMRLKRKHGLKKAAVAVGRKLSVTMHKMLKTGQKFQFTDREKTK